MTDLDDSDEYDNTSLTTSSSEEDTILEERKTYSDDDILTDCTSSSESSGCEEPLLKKRIKYNPLPNKRESTKNTAQNSKSTKSKLITSKSFDLSVLKCVFCEKIFDSIQKRNNHYKSKSHNVESEELVFFVDGVALSPETDYARRVIDNLEKFKALVERTNSEEPSKYSKCKLCILDCLKTEDVADHYKCIHKVEISKTKSLIRLKNSDLQLLVEPFKCPNCERLFDDISRLKMHLLSHKNETKCELCNKNVKKNVYAKHILEEHLNNFKNSNEGVQTGSSNDSDGTLSSKRTRIRKRKQIIDSSSKVPNKKKIARHMLRRQRTPNKIANKVPSVKAPCKNTPKSDTTSTRKFLTKRKSSSDSKIATSCTGDVPPQYDCKLCDVWFKSKQARNTHYTRTHKIENEKLIFLPDGTGLVESTFTHFIESKPDHLKTAAKNMSSRVCKLCKIELNRDDLKWHYEDVHKVIQISKVKPLICLNNSDIKIVADPFKCKDCTRTFDDASILKRHSLTHRGLQVKVHPDSLKTMRTTSNIVSIKKKYNRGVKINEDAHKNQLNIRQGQEKYNRVQKKCRLCPFKSSSLITLRKHKRSVHTRSEKSQCKMSKVKLKGQNNYGTVERRDNEKESQLISTSRDGRSAPTATQAIIMFFCEACHLAITSYDEAVSHSQDHILNVIDTQTTLCKQCNISFGADYQTHKQLHMIRSDLDIDSFQVITFNYKLLCTDEWLSMIDFLPEVNKKEISEKSVYFSTRCIRFKLPTSMKNASAPFLLFQCMTCKNYVDPFSIESHVQQQSCSIRSASYPCEVCQRLFYSDEARIQHSNTHKVSGADSKYRSISFNDRTDLMMNESLLQMKAASEVIDNRGRTGIVDKEVLTKEVPETLMNESSKYVRNCQNAGNAEENNANQKVATAYKCQCGLFFHKLSCMYDHLENCSNEDIDKEEVKCNCGLLFDKQNYPSHCEVHLGEYTTIQIKEVVLQAGDKIDISGMTKEKIDNVEGSNVNVTEHLHKANTEYSNPIQNSQSHYSITENNEDNTSQSNIQTQESTNIGPQRTLISKMKYIMDEYLKDIEKNGETQGITSQDVSKILEALNKNNTEYDNNHKIETSDNIVKSENTDYGDIYKCDTTDIDIKDEIDIHESDLSTLQIHQANSADDGDRNVEHETYQVSNCVKLSILEMSQNQNQRKI